jgi:protein-S-isoprenylcysteine O-methyltransferase Ste14
MKWKHFVDANKGVTFIAVLIMMAIFNQWENPTAWVYLALHGTYGWMWVIKSRVFPDKTWERPISLILGIGIWLGLTLYWIAPLIITSQNVRLPSFALGLLIALYILGVFLHFTSDMQKHISLKLQPNRLIMDGLWSLCRNPNYLGEFMIYLSFALLAAHWLPLVVLALYMAIIWFPNMRQKDRSLSRYAEFAAYKQRTKMFIPGVF